MMLRQLLPIAILAPVLLAVIEAASERRTARTRACADSCATGLSKTETGTIPTLDGRKAGIEDMGAPPPLPASSMTARFYLACFVLPPLANRGFPRKRDERGWAASCDRKGRRPGGRHPKDRNEEKDPKRERRVAG
ncbi:hypothetical protein MES4922_410015 [Mesorhizobium ventifaucium]|uniref:Secreted protein n=1 Tax=Mesorhizobium ventifaucium TaxID=666020 RepID=A0ABN8KB62_9HYPH|nr:hypothetical protein MES4922_410015 [Mesorhizobium ventifaucium]